MSAETDLIDEWVSLTGLWDLYSRLSLLSTEGKKKSSNQKNSHHPPASASSRLSYLALSSRLFASLEDLLLFSIFLIRFYKDFLSFLYFSEKSKAIKPVFFFIAPSHIQPPSIRFIPIPSLSRSLGLRGSYHQPSHSICPRRYSVLSPYSLNWILKIFISFSFVLSPAASPASSCSLPSSLDENAPHWSSNSHSLCSRSNSLIQSNDWTGF